MPSVPQMLCRMNDGHYRALVSIRSCVPILRANAGMGEVRGMRTCIRTLRRWGCIDSNGDMLTTTGVDLLRAWENKHARR